MVVNGGGFKLTDLIGPHSAFFFSLVLRIDCGWTSITQLPGVLYICVRRVALCHNALAQKRVRFAG